MTLNRPGGPASPLKPDAVRKEAIQGRRRLLAITGLDRHLLMPAAGARAADDPGPHVAPQQRDLTMKRGEQQ